MQALIAVYLLLMIGSIVGVLKYFGALDALFAPKPDAAVGTSKKDAKEKAAASSDSAAGNSANAAAGAAAAASGGVRSRLKGNRNRDNEASGSAQAAEAAPAPAAAAAAAANRHGSDNEDGHSGDEDDDATGKKKGKKKLAHEQAKAEAREAREAVRAAQQEKENKRAETQRAKDAEREAAQREADEAAQKEREEKEKKEKEEYDKWKHLFAVSEGGSVAEKVAEESQGLLQQFVDYIKTHKVVVLDDLAAHFGLRPKDVAVRVANLEQMGRITGVIDDRGKFIYITEDEMKAVAKYIEREGRISLTDLAAESNRLIRLTADA